MGEITTTMVRDFFLGFISGVSVSVTIWMVWTEAKRKRKRLERKIERLEEDH